MMQDSSDFMKKGAGFEQYGSVPANAKHCLKPPQSQRDKKGFCLEASGAHSSADTLILAF